VCVGGCVGQFGVGLGVVSVQQVVLFRVCVFGTGWCGFGGSECESGGFVL